MNGRAVGENQPGVSGSAQMPTFIFDPLSGPAKNHPKGVPPPEAFDKVKRRPPPNLPGYEKDRFAYNSSRVREMQRQQARQGAEAPAGAPPQTRQAPPRQKAPPKKVNPVKRRRNRRLIAAAIVLLLVLAGSLLTVNLLFKIETFTLNGESPYTLEEIVLVFGRDAGDNMYSFNAGSAKRRIEQGLPYIEQVTVRRSLPGTVVFEVEPAVEKYYVEEGGRYAVLSAGRKILRLADAPPEGLLRIVGLSQVIMTPGLPLAVEPSEPAPSVSASASPPPASLTSGDEPAGAQSLSEAAPASEAALAEAQALEEQQVLGQTAEVEAALGPGADTVEPQPEGEEALPIEGEGTEGTAPGEEAAGMEGEGEQGAPAEDEGGEAAAEPPSEAAPPAAPEPMLPAEPQPSSDALDVLTLLLDELQDAEMDAEVAWVNVGDALDLQFCWQGRIVVKLGAKGNMAEKLRFAKLLLTDSAQSQVTAGDRGTLDVSAYPASDRVWLIPG